MVNRLLLLLPLLACHCFAIAQDSTEAISAKLVSTYVNNIETKAGKLEAKLEQYTDKELGKLQRLEARIKQKLEKKSSAKAANVFADAEQQYKRLQEKLENRGKLQHYLPSLDSLTTSLKFLQENQKLVAAAKDGHEKLKQAMDKIKGMEGQMQRAEEIKNFIRSRKLYLKEQLQNIGFAKELKKLSKQSWYAAEQLKEYKAMLKDYGKAERKMLQLLRGTKIFKDFMAKNSWLASLFRMPENDPSSFGGAGASLAGLQTRSQVANLIQQTITGGGSGATQQLRQNIQQAQAQLRDIKSKMAQFGSGSSGDEMPDGFKSNPEKVRPFLKRLEYSANIQSQKQNGYLPAQSDIGLSIGYKLNDRSIIGLGGSYCIGWGRNIRHIRITQAGAGIRSFMDWKIRGSLWLTGAYEMNYRSAFRNIDELKNINAWQSSCLLGLSKVVSQKTKFFKKTKLQVMVDFLSYRQVPRSQPLIFRVGYNF